MNGTSSEVSNLIITYGTSDRANVALSKAAVTVQLDAAQLLENQAILIHSDSEHLLTMY